MKNGNSTNWRMIIKVIIAVATALLGALGAAEAGIINV
ncbi:MAG: smalltalk protein [Prevotella sp.]|nr:smalltalk protein [Prevotella sp.]